MSIDRNDVYRTAKYLIDHHGADAGSQAVSRAKEMHAAGDLDGLVFWKNVEGTVIELEKVAESRSSKSFELE